MTDRSEPQPDIAHYSDGSFDRGRQVGTWRTFDRTGRLVRETDFGAGDADGR